MQNRFTDDDIERIVRETRGMTQDELAEYWEKYPTEDMVDLLVKSCEYEASLKRQFVVIKWVVLFLIAMLIIFLTR